MCGELLISTRISNSPHTGRTQILKGCIGWEISRIGDLDVDL